LALPWHGVNDSAELAALIDAAGSAKADATFTPALSLATSS
jgi:hypothetical protein